jgi:alpha-ketoglutarate-dependent 2,4-dichlorophenoxyacetate dioxygenase
MSISFRLLHPGFAGEVSGVDLTRLVAAADVAAIEAGMDRHGVLVLPGQNLTDAQQVAYTRNFGEIELAVNSNVTQEQDRRIDVHLADVSNLDRDNRIFARDDRRRMFNLGNQLWHSDASFRVVPAKYSLLSGRAIPSWGGNTEFSDMRAAYDALDATTKADIEDLVCEHSLIYSRGQLGFEEFSAEELVRFKPVRHRLVRTHPVTGRKSIFLSSHIGAIVGWPVPEARAFIRDLTEHATHENFVYAHRWRRYDLVIWDNRQTMHRARRFADTGEVRDMRRTTVKGDGPTAAQISA